MIYLVATKGRSSPEKGYKRDLRALEKNDSRPDLTERQNSKRREVGR
jgi:hypothetical protein